MADPKTYPSLEQMLGEDDQSSEPESNPEPGEEHVGAKLWIMFLNRKT